MTAADTAAEGAAEVVQAAAKPIAFIATVIAGAAIVGYLVRRLGRALPVPDYVHSWLAPEPDTEPDTDEDDEGDE